MKKKAAPGKTEADKKPKAKVDAHMFKGGIDKKSSKGFKDQLIDDRLERKK